MNKITPTDKESGIKPEEKKEEPPKSTVVEIEKKGEAYLENLKEKERSQEHRYLQTFIKKIAEQRGFKSSLEEVIENGRIDVLLVKDSLQIACEIAVSNSVDYEVKNIQKCLSAGYSFVCVISKNENHLNNIREKAKNEIVDQNKVKFFTPDHMTEFLDSFI
jgi:hypothetical protein